MEQVKKLTQENKTRRGAAGFSINFLENLKTEFHKISWTSREELISYTKIVVSSTFIAGFAIYGVDLVIQGVLNFLSYLI